MNLADTRYLLIGVIMAKIINFFDGAESSTTPVIGNIKASSLTVHPNDAAFEAANEDAPEAGNIYYNSTDDKIHYYDADSLSWKILPDPADQIDATKIADGSVTNTEFQYINSLTSNAQDQLDAKIDESREGQNNGIATLDSGGKVPVSQLPNSVMEFKGSFDPATATFTDAGGNAGDVWLASAAGSYNAGSGSITYAIGDWAVHNGSIFEKSLNSNAVVSVNGQTGVVTLDLGANATLSNLTSPTAVNQDLLMNAGRTLRVPNNTAIIGRNAANSSNFNLALVNASDEIVLGSNLANTKMASTNVLPNGATGSLGGPSNIWNLYVNNVNTALTWPSNNATLRTAAAATTNPMIMTSGVSSAGVSGSITIGSGNATGGNSGSITLAVGSSTATRGDIIFQDGSQGTIGHIWTSIGVNGEGEWQANSPTVADNSITNAKLADVPTATFKGRTSAGTGDPQDLTVAQAKALLDLTGTNSGDQTITLTGDVTGSGTSSFAATIANDAVTNAKSANMAAWTLKARNNSASGDPQDVALADLTEEAAPASGDFLLGHLATGELRKFDIANISGSQTGILDVSTSYQIYEDFIGCALSTDHFPYFQRVNAGGASQTINTSLDRTTEKCIGVLQSTLTANTQGYNQQATTSPQFFVGSDVQRYRARFTTNVDETTNRNMIYMLGLATDVTAADYAASKDTGIYFVFEDGGAPTWDAVTVKGGVLTTTDTGHLHTSSVFSAFEIEYTSTEVVFKINGSIVATHTTNLPIDSDDLYAFYRVMRTTASGAIVTTYLDYIELSGTFSGSR